jgi:hypothetical protein
VLLSSEPTKDFRYTSVSTLIAADSPPWGKTRIEFFTGPNWPTVDMLCKVLVFYAEGSRAVSASSNWQAVCFSCVTGQRALEGPPLYMMKQTISILLTIILLGTHSGIAAALCRSAPEQADGSASKHCKMSQTTLPAPMSCCRPVDRGQRLTSAKKSPGCCHISLPLPNQSRPALPGSSSAEVRSHLQLQAAELDVVSLPFQTSVCSSSVSAIAFRLDRSDTYVQSSSLRI